MAFVNEHISESSDNWEKYGMLQIEKFVGPFSYSIPSTCTIDHERNIYLINVAHKCDSEHRPTGLTGWVFSWRGHMLWLELEAKEAWNWGTRNGAGGCKRCITRLGAMGEKLHDFGFPGKAPEQLPDELKKQRTEILKDLHAALLAAMAKISSEFTTYELTLEIAE